MCPDLHPVQRPEHLDLEHWSSAQAQRRDSSSSNGSDMSLGSSHAHNPIWSEGHSSALLRCLRSGQLKGLLSLRLCMGSWAPDGPTVMQLLAQALPEGAPSLQSLKITAERCKQAGCPCVLLPGSMMD